MKKSKKPHRSKRSNRLNVGIINEAIKASGIDGYKVGSFSNDHMIITPINRPEPMGIGKLTISIDMSEQMIPDTQAMTWVMDSFFVRFEGNVVVVDGSSGVHSIDLIEPDSIQTLNAVIKKELLLVKEYDSGETPQSGQSNT